MSPPKKQKITVDNSDEDLFIESQKLLAIENELCTKLCSMNFQSPIVYIYNPLQYAKVLHEMFVKKYFEHSTKKILFLGMNPGPLGMCQTGIPFGEINFVKEWLGVVGMVDKPENEHPKKKVLGLDCHLSERSGKRFWGFFKVLCGSPENFFKHSFIYNFCPLAFMNESGKNITPNEIKDKITKKQLNCINSTAFFNIVNQFNFEIVISIGQYAKTMANNTFKSNGITNVQVYTIPHPSPRNAKNSTNWEEETFKILQKHNLIKYFNDNPDFKSPFPISEQNDSR